MRKASKKTVLYDFAENEVKIAINRLDKDNSPYHLIENCYANALRAYDLLLNDDNLDLSMDFTRQILMRIIQKKPLSAIIESPDIWMEWRRSNDGTILYQCKRYGSLFKIVNGESIRYTDVTRAIGIDVENPEIPYGDLSVDSIVDEMFPIRMPYYPPNQPYKVYCRNYLFDSNSNRKDFDTTYVVSIRKPDGEKLDIGKAFAYTCGKWSEITIDEYHLRTNFR